MHISWVHGNLPKETPLSCQSFFRPFPLWHSHAAVLWATERRPVDRFWESATVGSTHLELVEVIPDEQTKAVDLVGQGWYLGIFRCPLVTGVATRPGRFENPPCHHISFHHIPWFPNLMRVWFRIVRCFYLAKNHSLLATAVGMWQMDRTLIHCYKFVAGSKHNFQVFFATNKTKQYFDSTTCSNHFRSKMATIYYNMLQWFVNISTSGLKDPCRQKSSILQAGGRGPNLTTVSRGVGVRSQDLEGWGVGLQHPHVRNLVILFFFAKNSNRWFGNCIICYKKIFFNHENIFSQRKGRPETFWVVRCLSLSEVRRLWRLRRSFLKVLKDKVRRSLCATDIVSWSAEVVPLLALAERDWSERPIGLAFGLKPSHVNFGRKPEVLSECFWTLELFATICTPSSLRRWVRPFGTKWLQIFIGIVSFITDQETYINTNQDKTV